MIKYIKGVAAAISLKTIVKRLQHVVLKWRGFEVLSDTMTIKFMSPCQIATIPEVTVIQPAIPNCIDAKKIVFSAKKRLIEQLYVWDYHDNKNVARLSKNGSVIIKRKVLSTDSMDNCFYKEIWKKDTRPSLMVACVLAPFSNYQEETVVKGYYDFVYMLAAKLCRIKDAMPNEDFSKMMISYVPFKENFEIEILQLLDFNIDNLIDSRITKVVSPRVITANKADWYPHIADILSLKRHIEKKFTPVKDTPKRIYISRFGRRHVKNEADLIACLKKFDFLIIEDKARTIIEQITIYHNASFILGPHGASFANIIWCQPGTHLFELLSPNYTPDFYAYLAIVMGLKHTAYYEGEPNKNVSYFEGLGEDIEVSVPKIEACLNAIFSDKAMFI